MEPKKRSLGAAERDEFLRCAWRLLFAGRVGAERLVFVDEMGTNVSLCPLYAWSRRGERVHAKAPRNWGKKIGVAVHAANIADRDGAKLLLSRRLAIDCRGWRRFGPIGVTAAR